MNIIAIITILVLSAVLGDYLATKRGVTEPSLHWLLGAVTSWLAIIAGLCIK